MKIYMTQNESEIGPIVSLTILETPIPQYTLFFKIILFKLACLKWKLLLYQCHNECMCVYSCLKPSDRYEGITMSSISEPVFNSKDKSIFLHEYSPRAYNVNSIFKWLTAAVWCCSFDVQYEPRSDKQSETRL